jgi:hypothetical protein
MKLKVLAYNYTLKTGNHKNKVMNVMYKFNISAERREKLLMHLNFASYDDLKSMQFLKTENATFSLDTVF